MVKVEGPPYIWIALTYGGMGRLIQDAKGDIFAGQELIRVDQFTGPDQSDSDYDVQLSLEASDGKELDADSWEFQRISDDGAIDSFISFEVFYLFYPLVPKWRQYFANAPFVTIPYPPLAPND